MMWTQLKCMVARVKWNWSTLSLTLKNWPRCELRFLSVHTADEVCDHSDKQPTVCFYVAELRSRTIHGGCAFPQRAVIHHRFASVCKTKQSLETLQSTKAIDIFSGALFTRVFCCYARISCFAVAFHLWQLELNADMVGSLLHPWNRSVTLIMTCNLVISIQCDTLQPFCCRSLPVSCSTWNPSGIEVQVFWFIGGDPILVNFGDTTLRKRLQLPVLPGFSVFL
uniref:Reverse transcriptase RNase H-like domain-containing protein n=1 Tax=Parascaris univalens TaxID=6257 RepID=A0A915A0L7_PARUN